MTYRELYEKALDDLEHNKITLGEFEERVKPLNQEPTSVIEKLEKIIAKIDSEEKWLINIKTENGFIPMIDICNAMYRIRRTISELKGEDK